MPSPFTLEQKVQRILDTRLLEIINVIIDQKLTEEKKIHEIRKGFKKIRAFLKLIRHDLKKPQTYVSQNDYYKNASKRFSNIRDKSVLEKTYQLLQKEYDLINQFGKSLLINTISIDNAKAFNILQHELIQKRQTLHIYKLKKEKHPLKKALNKIYHQLLTNKQKAYESSSDEAFHEWRKSVKNYMYQLELFKNNFPTKIKKELKELKTLADILGLDHDLCVLKEFFYLRDKNSPIILYAIKKQKVLRQKAFKYNLQALQSDQFFKYIQMELLS
jgi:CHAD domain-containing protein